MYIGCSYLPESLIPMFNSKKYDITLSNRIEQVGQSTKGRDFFTEAIKPDERKI